MEKVDGFGGFFFRAKDPKALAEWYQQHMGIDPAPEDYSGRCWQQSEGATIFAPFAQDTAYFGDPGKGFMLNFRVRDLAAMIAQLRAAGIEVQPDPGSPYPNGSFARLTDPEGNPIELWQPA
ncbi:VOC family protein [Ruegeria pomeroyi]|uniref:VOC family protein n=1 Tax=Ruegeria pomeroyi TaxID=89184 RepID=UPI001F21FC85|nr:VOC family protein [Ruegeria pomeroyi]MCE8510747.1 VOC family protein [Ruegeria pomeroyi]